MFKFLKKKIANFGSKLSALLGKKLDEETLSQLEELLYEADLGSTVTESLLGEVRSVYRKDPKISSDGLIDAMKKKLIQELTFPASTKPHTSPYVILIVGANGNGKTTSVAKLANYYRKMGKSVLVAAGDTFRAAGVEQLALWAERAGITIVKGKMGSDPAAVAFDAITSAKSRNIDVVIIDTAGRLHTKTDLMQELEKIRRVSDKALPGAPHETFLVLDATIGQNGVAQAKIFHSFTPLSGLILTKLDGTAKGGSAIALQKSVNLPIKFVGVGEGLEDIEPFNPQTFVNELLSN